MAKSIVPIIQNYAQFMQEKGKQQYLIAKERYQLGRKRRADELGSYYSELMTSAQDTDSLSKVYSEAYRAYLSEGLGEFADNISRLAVVKGQELGIKDTKDLAQFTLDVQEPIIADMNISYKGDMIKGSELMKQIKSITPDPRKQVAVLNEALKTGKLERKEAVTVDRSGNPVGGVYFEDAAGNIHESSGFYLKGKKVMEDSGTPGVFTDDKTASPLVQASFTKAREDKRESDYTHSTKPFLTNAYMKDGSIGMVLAKPNSKGGFDFYDPGGNERVEDAVRLAGKSSTSGGITPMQQVKLMDSEVGRSLGTVNSLVPSYLSPQTVFDLSDDSEDSRTKLLKSHITNYNGTLQYDQEGLNIISRELSKGAGSEMVRMGKITDTEKKAFALAYDEFSTKSATRDMKTSELLGQQTTQEFAVNDEVPLDRLGRSKGTVESVLSADNGMKVYKLKDAYGWYKQVGGYLMPLSPNEKESMDYLDKSRNVENNPFNVYLK